MAEGMCATCSRYLLIAFNFLFWVSGGALLGLGIWVRVDSQVEDTIKQFVHINLPVDVLYAAAYVFIAVGTFIFVTGFCGCCGAIRESACMLAIYIGCLTVVILGELTAGVYLAIERTNLEQMFNENLSSQVQNYTDPGNSTMDFLQIQFDCCGSYNYSEFNSSVYAQNLPEQSRKEWFVPDSCCVAVKVHNAKISDNDKRTCQKEAKTMMSSNTKQLRTAGCYDKIMKMLYTNSAILIGVGMGVAFLAVLGIILSICLCRNRTEYWEWE
ncbi:CD82 antigen-like [Mizuhopecten yessoensis]|uniref:CD82 antigen-like n=1 Tax=Mizuhopecten yessoensis TaxID=6573 RepID=UPI000B45F6F6|nr:CD82 antigen-like [Mizuhopecten yessoensis]